MSDEKLTEGLGSPANISFLLHTYSSPEPHPNAAAFTDLIDDLLHDGIIDGLSALDLERGRWKCTALGNAWVNALCQVPPPKTKEIFVDEQGREVK